jgi:protocatechuate 4,5-dioxygenase beta chain
VPKVIPLAVNVVQYPPPTGHRCYMLGKAIRRAVESFDKDRCACDLRHGRHVAPVARPARRTDQQQVRQRIPRQHSQAIPNDRAKIPHIEYVREAGSEGIELVMWLIMRGAIGEHAKEIYRFYHVPASNTAVGHLILENAS